MHRFELRPLAVPAALLLAVTLAAACDRSTTANTSSLVVERDTVGDTIVVRTIAGSMWGDSVRLVEELRLGEADGDGGAYTMINSGIKRVGETMLVSYAFLHLDSTGTARDTIQMPTWPEIPPPMMRFYVRGLNAFQPHGAFAVARSDRYVVDVPDAAGRVLRVERPSVAPIDLLPQERADEEAFFTALAQRNPIGERITVPSTKPLIRTLKVAPDGRLWVQLHTRAVESGEPRDSTSTGLIFPDHWIEPEAWDVFDPDGTFLGHLELPPRATLQVMRGDRAWGTVLDGDDVPYLVRWRVSGTGGNTGDRENAR